LPAEALKGNSNLRNIHIAPSRGSSIYKYLSLLRTLRRNKYKVAIDFLSTPGSAILTRMTGASTRIGYRLRGRSFFYNHPVKRSEVLQYSALKKFELVKQFNIEPMSLDLEIVITEADKRVASEKWQTFGFDHKSIIFGIAPWSKRPWRRWENHAWLSVISKISEQTGARWLLFAGENERQYLTELENVSFPDVRWAGAQNIQTAAALMQRCTAILSAENGLMHIAVAAKVPKLSLFTSSDSPQAWNPPDKPEYQGLDLRNTDYDEEVISRVVETFNDLLRVTDSKTNY
ncbi:MAG: glycosyltransferase family 9 protein, partial [Calditrichaeota bacterium]|nr:glycosyltransferase family 9 protein [Calditrichota bacterium]